MARKREWARLKPVQGHNTLPGITYKNNNERAIEKLPGAEAQMRSRKEEGVELKEGYPGGAP
jgi:hypothetical protein